MVARGGAKPVSANRVDAAGKEYELPGTEDDTMPNPRSPITSTIIDSQVQGAAGVEFVA